MKSFMYVSLASHLLFLSLSLMATELEIINDSDRSLFVRVGYKGKSDVFQLPTWKPNYSSVNFKHMGIDLEDITALAILEPGRQGYPLRATLAEAKEKGSDATIFIQQEGRNLYFTAEKKSAY